MRILILAGKHIEKTTIRTLLGGTDFVLNRHENVSRGVRRLEKESVDAVLLIPGPADATCSRATHRIREEYGLWSIVLTPGDTPSPHCVKDAFESFPADTVTARDLERALLHLERHHRLESELAAERATARWLEKTGRSGSWEMDDNGVTTWSEGARRILRDDQGMLTGEFNSVRQFVHPDDLDIYDQANKATFHQGWPLDFEYRIRAGDGEIRYLHLHRRVELGPDGKVARAYGMIRDVTAERQFEQYLFRRDAILQVVGSFAERFLRESDWESGIDAALASLGKAADVSRVFVFRKSPGQDKNANLTMIGEWTAHGIPPLIKSREVQDQPFATYARWRAALVRRKIVAGHVRNFQSEERKFFERVGTRSLMVVPIFVGSKWWGVIGFSDHRDERDWLPVEIESMTMVADIFGSAILRRAMEDQLVEANRSAEDAKTIALEASKAKSRFLANMSHEIRTPISGILGMAEMTITTGLTSEQREHLDMIREAGRSLLNIINDVLDISKIEADKLEFRLEDFDLRAMLASTMRPFKPQADAKSVDFRHTVEPDVPTHLLGDPDRLGQVVRNLAGNALKFTETGFVEVRVEVAETDRNRICLRFTVRDSGEGIPDDMLDAIFDSFTQVDSSARKQHQGTGLGLTISKRLVEMMDGHIGVESEPGKGSTFSFTAWFEVSEKASIPAEAQTAPPQTLHLHILMAEDNPLNQKFLTHFLSMFGHTVTVANNGIEALDTLRKHGREIDLVLMDIQMPGMGGIEATQAIRTSDGKFYDPEIPVIALTAYAMKGDRDRMLQAGMDEYVSKPVDMKELSAAIARTMATRKKGPKVILSPTSSQAVRDRVADEPVHIELDMESLMDRFEGNRELLADILDLFLLEADQKLVRLDEAIDAEDPDSLGPALHSITNLASHVLAMDVVDLSRKLERQCYNDTFEEVADGVLDLRPMFTALIQAVRGYVKTV